MGKSKDNLGEAVFSFHCESEDGTQDVTLGSKLRYPLNYLINLLFFFLRCVRVLHVGVDECLYVYICVSACSHVSVESYG